MNKIGIITHYYKSENYGGNLQAYAMSKYLQAQGFSAEQVSFDFLRKIKDNKNNEQKVVSGFFCIKNVLKKIWAARKWLRYRVDVKHGFFEKRRNAFQKFNQDIIPHSNKIYTVENIHDSVSNYDAFLSGSDQVWNFRFYKPEWFLSFVPSTKKKISYAASMAMDDLIDQQKQIIKGHLKDFNAISVREKRSVELLRKLAPMEPQYVLDPVLLLTKEEWDTICAERVIKEKYLFCYFLGDNKKARKLAKKYAQEHKLKLVHIPKNAGVDFNFGDYRIFDASPQQFVSLIKHAEYIFTDSFHATVFSFIYQKQYFVFNRDGKGTMNSRITDITELFEATERFCQGEEKETIKYINNLPRIDYEKPYHQFKELREKSIEFLLSSLKD